MAHTSSRHVGALAILCLFTSLARADELRGPPSVFEGETAIFYTRTKSEIPLRAIGRDGSVVRFNGARAFTAGEYTIRLDGNVPGVSGARRLTVRPLPPFVSPDLPVERRLAALHVAVWDGDKTTKGRVLEEAGRFAFPRFGAPIYPVQRTLSGRQATRANVDFALAELGRRGYVLDVFVAAHGYPIELADGEWTDVGRSKGLANVRLFYTTACYGSQGQAEFRAAGVRTYVAASDVNNVNSFHMYHFMKAWRAGRTVEQATADANRAVNRLVNAPILGWLLRKTVIAIDKDPRNNAGTTPHVYGDRKLTVRTGELRGVTSRASRGLARALGVLD